LSTAAELKAWQSEIQQHFEQEIQHHFAAEEAHLFPVARQHTDLMPLVDELRAEHSQLRRYFTQAAAGSLDRASLRQFADSLSGHIRKEERQLFEGMQKAMTPAELQSIGAGLDESFASLPEACVMPTESTLKSTGP